MSLDNLFNLLEELHTYIQDCKAIKEENVQLKSQLEAKDDQIAELEGQIEAKNTEVAAKEEQIIALQAQVEAAKADKAAVEVKAIVNMLTTNATARIKLTILFVLSILISSLILML